MRGYSEVVVRCVDCGRNCTAMEAYLNRGVNGHGRCRCGGSFTVSYAGWLPAAGEAQAVGSVSSVNDAKITEG